MAMRMGCAEVRGAVENLWNAIFALVFRGFGGGWCGKLLFHVERSGFSSSLSFDRPRDVPRGTFLEPGSQRGQLLDVHFRRAKV